MTLNFDHVTIYLPTVYIKMINYLVKGADFKTLWMVLTFTHVTWKSNGNIQFSMVTTNHNTKLGNDQVKGSNDIKGRYKTVNDRYKHKQYMFFRKMVLKSLKCLQMLNSNPFRMNY